MLSRTQLTEKELKKGQQIIDAHEKKLVIIQNNCDLSPEEKDVLYTKYLKKLNKQKNALQREQNVRDAVLDVVQATERTEALAAYAGVLGLAAMAVGGFGIAAAVTSGSEILTGLTSTLAGLGAIATIYGALNQPKNSTGTTVIEDIDTKLWRKNKLKELSISEVEQLVSQIRESNAQCLHQSEV